jgi:hypothetical protein
MDAFANHGILPPAVLHRNLDALITPPEPATILSAKGRLTRAIRKSPQAK